MSAPPSEPEVSPEQPPAARAWRLRTRLGVVFGALASLGLLLIAVVVVSTVVFVRAGNDVIYQWQPAVVNGQRLLTDLVDQETGVRGYVLSGETAFLTPYRSALQNQARDVTRLHQLIDGDPALKAQLGKVLDAASVWQQSVAVPAIGAVGVRSRAQADGIVDSDDAKDAFDLIRSTSADLSAQLVARTLTARARRTDAGYVFIVALSLALAVVVLAGLLLWRGLQKWVLGPIDRLGGRTRVVASGATNRVIEADGPAEITDLGRDVEAMRRQIAAELARVDEVRAQLEHTAADLTRSNEDLQQFAYVASHDLSEPLRKVANFCQLLERQYGPQLDDRARQYIDFAVDGAKRMQALINDLLDLSRVGRTTEAFVEVDLDAAMDQALRTLRDKLADSDGRVERTTALPTVPGDRTLLTSLLENLIGNAIKYRSSAPPVVTVSAELDEVAARWQITVADNGIGIDPQYAERIFVVFQRLHLRDQYGGTGIGLALCRRIVEFHGGHIALMPPAGDPVVDGSGTDGAVRSHRGATFRFTLPAGEPIVRTDDAEQRDRTTA